MREYTYGKLRGRIVERYGTQLKFAEAIGFSIATVSYKLNGRRSFSQDDIKRWADALGIEMHEYGEYFFT